eukprot:CAMPEP_0176492540 /NCGR_PEP_ID=MMETSP0200_2-20121128/9061_1 /TAXON_ID=947934 /ORGANISM="Chaetoceros sp., Strain GSL56" /LENGTH=227 /DNA_ID=CAMNT_0017890125 /DNA_START=60 /DNA_END=743 /DNA_ORIENTATION=-
MMVSFVISLFLISSLTSFYSTHALNIVIAGGTGKVGRLLSSTLHQQQQNKEDDNNNNTNNSKITILCRNAFLASTPTRVSGDFGWLGESFLNQNYSIRLRDWDGGDLLDIVGCDWMGWQDDVLPDADVIVNLVGGYTQQRTMACERLVRESLARCKKPNVQHILMSMDDEDLKISLKKKRAKECEDMLIANCLNVACLRAELNDVQRACDKIMDVIVKYKSNQEMNE